MEGIGEVDRIRRIVWIQSILWLGLLSCSGQTGDSFGQKIISEEDCRGYCELVAGCYSSSVSDCTDDCRSAFDQEQTPESTLCITDGRLLIDCLEDATCESLFICGEELTNASLNCSVFDLPLPPVGQGLCRSCSFVEYDDEVEDTCEEFADPFDPDLRLACSRCDSGRECTNGIFYRCAPTSQFISCQDGQY